MVRYRTVLPFTTKWRPFSRSSPHKWVRTNYTYYVVPANNLFDPLLFVHCVMTVTHELQLQLGIPAYRSKGLHLYSLYISICRAIDRGFVHYARSKSTSFLSFWLCRFVCPTSYVRIHDIIFLSSITIARWRTFATSEKKSYAISVAGERVNAGHADALHS